MVAKEDRIGKLVTDLIDAAIKQDEATITGDGKDARKYGKQIIRTWDAIIEIGESAKEDLSSHLWHPHPSARLRIAAFLLKYKHNEAMAVLRDLAKGEGLVSFCAQEAIKRWEEGTWALE